MPDPSPRQLVLELLAPALRRHSMPVDDVDDSLNVIDRGIVDSIEFLNLVARLEQRTGAQLELFDVDPDVLTTIGGLVNLVAHATTTRPTSSRSMTHD